MSANLRSCRTPAAPPARIGVDLARLLPGNLAKLWRIPLKNLLCHSRSLALFLAFAAFPSIPIQAAAQSVDLSPTASASHTRDSDSTASEGFNASSSSLDAVAPDPSPALPAAPEPAIAGYDHYEVAPSATWHQIPFSRVGIGADLSPLGIGIKGAIVLNHYFDARVMGNFFDYNTGRFEVQGFNVNADFHLSSTALALDFYPLGSVFRISPGLLLTNGNQISGGTDIVPGTSFTLNGQNYYSASANPSTGATPIVGSGVLSYHRQTPAFTATGGFGKFIPRSNRHWSFPFEIGAAFTGSPIINVHVSGWACLDAKQTMCSNIASASNPIGLAFTSNLQTQINKWQNDLNKVGIYPILSSSVMYSFNIR